MRNEELLSASEEKLIEYYESQIAPHVGIAASTLLSELQRRATARLISATEQVRESTERLAESTERLLTETAKVANSSAKLAESSDRLERYTFWLIMLTVLVLLVAAPPAIEAIARWFG
jgi:hypothetical protein